MALTTTEEAQTRALIAQNAALLSLASSEPTIISKLAATKASLSDLPVATVKNNTDLFLVRQGTEDKSITGALAGGDAAYVSYTPAGVGAIATTVQGELRKQVWLDDYDTLAHAIAALGTNGGVVNVPVGRFPAGNWTYDSNYMSTANVTIRGVKMPYLSANADRLDGGSVIYGRFNAFADNFSVEDIGFDLGKYTVDTYFGGLDTHSANHPLGGTWDAFAFAQPNMASPLVGKKNFYASNVIGLCRDSLSLGHAVLMEGFDGGRIDNVIGMYGVHATVIKATNVSVGTITGYSAGADCLIIKSDTYAWGGHITIDTADVRRFPPGLITPWSTPAQTTYGVMINPETAVFAGPVQIGKIKAFGQTNGVCLNGASDAMTAPDIQIGEILVDGFGSVTDYAFIASVGQFHRCYVGHLTANNVTQALYWKNTAVTQECQLQVGSIQATNVVNSAIYAMGAANIRIGIVEIRSAGAAYYIDDTALLQIGDERLSGVTTKWGRNAPALNAGWANNGGSNSFFDVLLKGYKVELQGLVQAGASPSATIVTLPPYLKPAQNKRHIAYFNTGIRTTALVGIDSATSTVILNDGTAPLNTNYVSLDGISWRPGA